MTQLSKSQSIIFHQNRLTLFAACVFLLVGGCANPNTEVMQVPEPLEPPVVKHTGPMSAGAIWTGDESNWIADLRAQNVGDIVTVIILEKASASKEASTETGRDSGIKAGFPSFFGLEKTVVVNNPNLDPSNLIEANIQNTFKGSGKTTRKEDLLATLTTQVVKVYPNGNMKIRGGKSVVVNNENQIIYLTGIIRPYDVSAANEVDSSKILNAQIAYTGKGIISDKQRPGWLGRIVDRVWPF
ncbi:MAG: flagellar basal body L-ring protein FlgH [Desulfobulbaceae bacterium]|nr:flagellar basal body L-ring protein FlgH [Desulfobulbaceae bacterium]